MFQQWILVLRRRHRLGIRFCGSVGPPCELQTIEPVVVLLQLSHFLDFVKVDDEAGVQVVQVLDALSAEDGRVLTAVKVLDSLVVILAHVDGAIPFVGFLALIRIRVCLETLLKVDRREERVPRYHLV